MNCVTTIIDKLALQDAPVSKIGAEKVPHIVDY